MNMKNEISKINTKTPEIRSKTPSEAKDLMAENWFTKFFKEKMVLYIHIFVYAAVNGLLLMLNLMNFHGRLWVVTSALGWLIGLSLHYTIYTLTDKAMFTKKDGLKASLYIHLTVYVFANILMVWGNIALFQGFLWVPIVAFGWCIGLGVHYIVAYYYPNL